MTLKKLFGKRLPSLDEKNKKFKESKKVEEKEDELTEEELEHVNGITTQEEWETILKTKRELEGSKNTIKR